MELFNILFVQTEINAVIKGSAVKPKVAIQAMKPQIISLFDICNTNDPSLQGNLHHLWCPIPCGSLELH